MPEIGIKATKMKSADALFISMVPRGANRLPFKIVKQENDMQIKALKTLDLSNVFKREKPTPEVVAIAVAKGEGFESIKKQIEDAGFSVANMTERDDGTVIFAQKEGDVEGDVIIRLNDHVAMVTKGFMPYSMDMDVGGVAFADQCKAQGFYPGVNIIVDALGESIRKSVYDADSPSDAKEMVIKLMDEAKVYVAEFIGALPSKAFKMDTIAPVAAEKTEEPAQVEGEDPAKTEEVAKGGEGETTEGEGVEKTAETAPVVTEPEPAGDSPVEKAETSLTAEEVSSIVASQVGEAMGGLVAKFDELIKTVKNEVTASVTAVKQSVDEIGSRVDQAESVAKAATEAVTGKVVLGAETGDVTTKKTETSMGMGDIDTAFMPKRSRNR